jgi:UrcA family protein
MARRPVRVHVEWSDLDLNKPADARTLLERLKRAAYVACGGDPKLHNSYRTRLEKTVAAYEECRANAVKRAIDQIGAQQLTQLYTGCSKREERRVSALLRAAQ